VSELKFRMQKVVAWNLSRATTPKKMKETNKDIYKTLCDIDKLFSDLIPKIEWNIGDGAEGNPNFDLKVRAETCWDRVAYAKKHSADWLNE